MTYARWSASPTGSQEIKRALERRDFTRWLKTVTPTWSWDWAHLQLIREKLALVTSGECKRLMLLLPPRHGKSEMVTIRFPVWTLESKPTAKIIIAAYNQTLAESFSRKARRIGRDRLDMSTQRATAGEWETTLGGGMRAVGVGVGITGHGGDLIIIDDPVKNREEADSEAYRERVWEWYTDDLYTRLEPDGAIVLIQTRWHEDDLAGRILESDQAGDWTVIKLPAEAEANDPLGRAEGEALCPERFDLAALADIKAVQGRSYWALYQQTPHPKTGGMFERDWFTIVEASPIAARRSRYWDKAASISDKAAYTAGVLVAIANDGMIYVEDAVRGRWKTGAREKVIKQVAELDAARRGNTILIGLEQEPGSGGLDSARDSVKNLAAYPVVADRVTGSKDVRLQPFARQAEALNVRLVHGPWNEAFIAELCSIPYGKFRDQADGVGGAYNLAVQLPEYVEPNMLVFEDRAEISPI